MFVHCGIKYVIFCFGNPVLEDFRSDFDTPILWKYFLYTPIQRASAGLKYHCYFHVHLTLLLQYRLFVGLTVNTPIWHKVDKNAPEPSPEEDDDDDCLSDEVPGEEEPTANVTVGEAAGPGQREWPPRRRPRPPYANYGKEPPEVETDGEILELLAEARSVKEDKMTDFLNDPEKSTKIFLSSYMREQGLIW